MPTLRYLQLIFIWQMLFLNSCWAQTLNKEVQLLSWKAGECDNSYDPYHIQDRISAIAVRNNTLFLSVSFSENCCIIFSPKISYSNHILSISSDSKEDWGYCLCDCCFSIDFVISNISDTNFTTLFNGDTIYYSLDPYRVFPIKFEVVNGDTINKNNERGVPIGLWVKNLDSTLYNINPKGYDYDPIWSKKYYPNGQIESFASTGSITHWFEKGSIKSNYKYYPENNDHIRIEKIYEPDGKLKKYEITRQFSKTNLLNAHHLSMPRFNITEHLESYDAGQLREYVNQDTIKKWDITGNLELWEYGDSSMHYYTNGNIKSWCKKWLERNIDSCDFIETRLCLEFDTKGYVVKKKLYRDEFIVEINGGEIFFWEWDSKNKLIDYSPDYKGKVPMTKKIKKMFALKKLP